MFGPLIACGAGGTLVELLGDLTVSLAPVSPRAAGEMLQRLRTYPLLTGYRGSQPTNVAALTDRATQKVAMMASATSAQNIQA